jgi:membrane protein implicated in regulation of membrane protease activity
MVLIAYYVVFMIAGDFAAYFIGLLVEYEWGPQVSLVVFLCLYFLFLWVAWLLAVRLTRPKEAPVRKRAGSPALADDGATPLKIEPAHP